MSKTTTRRLYAFEQTKTTNNRCSSCLSKLKLRLVGSVHFRHSTVSWCAVSSSLSYDLSPAVFFFFFLNNQIKPLDQRPRMFPCFVRRYSNPPDRSRFRRPDACNESDVCEIVRVNLLSEVLTATEYRLCRAVYAEIT